MVDEPVRILVVDDQRLFRDSLSALLDSQPGLRVVGVAADGAAAIERAAALGPDVVLMDLHMPVLDGVAATRRLGAEQPRARVIALTTFDDDEYVFEALRAGAIGYLLKDVSGERLVEAVRGAARGETFLQPSIAAKVVAEFARVAAPRGRPLDDPLSRRELEVLRLLATGATNREIADALFIAEGTAKNHLTSVLSKLGARDRLGATIRAKELGLI